MAAVSYCSVGNPGLASAAHTLTPVTSLAQLDRSIKMILKLKLCKAILVITGKNLIVQ